MLLHQLLHLRNIKILGSLLPAFLLFLFFSDINRYLKGDCREIFEVTVKEVGMENLIPEPGHDVQLEARLLSQCC